MSRSSVAGAGRDSELLDPAELRSTHLVRDAKSSVVGVVHGFTTYWHVAIRGS